jgi:hypothetical protein
MAALAASPRSDPMFDFVRNHTRLTLGFMLCC